VVQGTGYFDLLDHDGEDVRLQVYGIIDLVGSEDKGDLFSFEAFDDVPEVFLADVTPGAGDKD
jgi:hypothetical protein